MNREDIAYMAGLVDGEGCIVIFQDRKPKGGHLRPTLRLVISMTKPAPLLWAKETFGGSFFKAAARHQATTCWTWVAAGQRALRILRLLFPYLKVKKKNALLAEIWGSYAPGHGGHGVHWDPKVMEFLIKKSHQLNQRWVRA